MNDLQIIQKNEIVIISDRGYDMEMTKSEFESLTKSFFSVVIIFHHIGVQWKLIGNLWKKIRGRA